MKVKCISKNRNAKGVILNYILQDERGQVIKATGQQIKKVINTGQYDFVNLQVDKAGRLVDKAMETPVKQPEHAKHTEQVKYIEQAKQPEHAKEKNQIMQKFCDNFRKFVFETIKTDGIIVKFNPESYHELIVTADEQGTLDSMINEAVQSLNKLGENGNEIIRNELIINKYMKNIAKLKSVSYGYYGKNMWKTDVVFSNDKEVIDSFLDVRRQYLLKTGSTDEQLKKLKVEQINE